MWQRTEIKREDTKTTRTIKTSNHIITLLDDTSLTPASPLTFPLLPVLKDKSGYEAESTVPCRRASYVVL